MALLVACTGSQPDQPDADTSPVVEPSLAAVQAPTATPSPAGRCPAGNMRGKVGFSREPEFCIAWRDEFSNELGFRIVLRFSPSDEELVYHVGPDVRDFFFPPSDRPDTLPPPDTPCAFCGLKRKDFGVTVYALLPSGEVVVDGFFLIIG
jgi:hypothetical protein